MAAESEAEDLKHVMLNRPWNNYSDLLLTHLLINARIVKGGSLVVLYVDQV